MPSDANGVYSLPEGYLAVTGETILASQHNPPLEDLAESMSQRVMASGAKPFSGPAKFADGSASSPSLTFQNGQTTGVYKTADGIGVAVGGAMVAEFTSGGIRTGARYIGELIPYSGVTAPALTVFPYGQTLSRTAYPALWAFAQTQIAANHQFYNNGNGSTTFGIGDMRGRVPAGNDAMGGSAASRLTSSFFGAGGQTIGDVGGLQSNTLTLAQLPTGITSSGSNSITVTSTQSTVVGASLSSQPATGGAAQAWNGTAATLTSTGSNSISVTSNNTSGSAHNNVQPTMIVNYLLFAGA